MNKHTPGPWRVNEGYDKDSGLKLHRVVFGTSIVAECYGINSKTNARLIAASPELLAMLKKLVYDCSGDSLGTLKLPRWEFVCEAAALLHKATGESQ